jgi:PAS domain S-box-containing protein
MLSLFEREREPGDTIRFMEEKAGAGIWRWDLKSRKMEWSPGLFRLLGIEPGSLDPSYALFHKMVHPDDICPPGEIERILGEGGSIERVFRIVRSDGRIRSILNRGELLVDRSGKPAKAIGVVLDVTRLHEALSTVEAIQERFSGLVEAVSVIAWTVNADGVVGDIPLWRKFTGQSLADVSGHGWFTAIHPDDRQGAVAAWNVAVANRARYEFEYRLRRADNVYRWVRARAIPVFRKDGSVREWVGVCIDIQDQKLWSTPRRELSVAGAQLRAARGILNWSVRDLAEAAGISASTIRRLEEINGPPLEPEPALAPLREAFEKAGVEFLFPPIGNAGVRLR